ncbi:MAG: CPBP family intramembrane glutamic endopeptidase [Crocinitomicaceae bacterium]|nr:CPBP family intramembrane metalloprotease [Crocinitomicaceae bacterium]
MKTFFKYIKDHFKEDFDWKSHAAIGIFLAVLIGFNYGVDAGKFTSLYDEMVHINYKSQESVLYLFLLNSTVFILAIWIISSFSGQKKLWNKKYIIFGLIGLFFLSLDCSYYIMQFVNVHLFKYPFVYGWAHHCLSNLSSTVTVIIPLYLLYAFTKDFKSEFYGFKLNGAKIGPYLWLILFMIPLIYIASFRPDFLETYPTYHDRQEYIHLGMEQWQTAGIYELCYGFDFISVELFFRGFLVIGLSRLIGKESILVMVVIYCVLHFGKPAGEAISSIFGGYILGILAFRSRNIFGGLIVHLGVAWGMELMAYLQM